MFKYLKLQNKLLIAFGFLIAILIISSGTAVWQIQTIHSKIQQALLAKQPIELLLKAQLATRETARTLLAYTQAPSPLRLQTKEDNERYFDTFMREYIDIIEPDSEKQLGLRIIRLFDTLKQKNPREYQLYERDFMEIDRLLTQKVQQLTRESVKAAEQATTEYSQSALFTHTLISEIGIIAGLIMAFFLAHIISVPLNKIMQATNKIAKGEVDIEIEIDSKDEMGELANTYKNLISNTKSIIAVADAIGTGNYSVELTPRSDKDVLGKALIQMKNNLQTLTTRTEEQRWLKAELARISGLTQGIQNLPELTETVLQELALLVRAGCGAFYIQMNKEENAQKESFLQLFASYAYNKDFLSNRIQLGESLVGQAAIEKEPILLTEVPADYIKIQSGLGQSAPLNVLVMPILFEEELMGVIELASFHHFTEFERDLIQQISTNVGISIHNVLSRQHTEELLRQSQILSEELQIQQKKLKASHEALEEKAKALELANKYKSEFLANVSHELRTPLNSLLILSKSFSENESGNLTPEQIEEATVIYKGGQDLLKLINEILDLSKIESGKMNLEVESTDVPRLVEGLFSQFKVLAQNKGLTFKKIIAEDVPRTVLTDPQRLEQVLKNLLSNAFKFTEKGSITLTVEKAAPGTEFYRHRLSTEEVLAFTVADTGIGIPEDRQKDIFEAFHQVDGSTSRRYGGTGLGLTISREMTNLLGGEIHLKSNLNEGSIFTLYLPVKSVPILKSQVTPEASPAVPENEPKPQIHSESAAEKTKLNNQKILLVDDDMRNVFALSRILQRHGLNILIAANGKMALDKMAQENDIELVIMDIMMPVMDGYTAITHIRKEAKYQQLPIIALTAKAMPEDRAKCLEVGANDYMAKPVDADRLLSMIKQWLIDKKGNK